MNKRIFIFLLSFISLAGCSGTTPKLGLNNGKLTPCPNTPNCVSSQATDKEHMIEPLVLIGTSTEAKEYLLKLLKPWERAKVIEVDQNYIRAEFTSKIFRFVDDVEFYFPPVKTEKISIQVRSASRIGHSDFDANRKRIELLRKKLKG